MLSVFLRVLGRPELESSFICLDTRVPIRSFPCGRGFAACVSSLYSLEKQSLPCLPGDKEPYSSGCSSIGGRSGQLDSRGFSNSVAQEGRVRPVLRLANLHDGYWARNIGSMQVAGSVHWDSQSVFTIGIVIYNKPRDTLWTTDNRSVEKADADFP